MYGNRLQEGMNRLAAAWKRRVGMMRRCQNQVNRIQVRSSPLQRAGQVDGGTFAMLAQRRGAAWGKRPASR